MVEQHKGSSIAEIGALDIDMTTGLLVGSVEEVTAIGLRVGALRKAAVGLLVVGLRVGLDLRKAILVINMGSLIGSFGESTASLFVGDIEKLFVGTGRIIGFSVGSVVAFEKI